MIEILEKFDNHPFVQSLLLDSNEISKGRNFKMSDIELINPEFDEYEYYIHNSGFYLVHFLELCRQLENAVELLSNFRYNKDQKIGRIDHLTYNIENYFIRLISLSDRMLQLINATFHLGIDEKQVNDRIILNNLKVSRTPVVKKFKTFNNVIKDYNGERNTVVHRHAYMDKKLRRLQLFYHKELSRGIVEDPKKGEDFKIIRKDMLTKFISDRKKEYEKTNNECFVNILPILDELEIYYKKMKIRLGKSA